MGAHLIIALTFAFVAGFALQRGGVCAVAAVRDVVDYGQWRRFVGFVECAAWALLGLLLIGMFGGVPVAAWPVHATLAAPIAGGALFGIGALLNGACAFGSAGRLAAGETSFLGFLAGFKIGAAAARVLTFDAPTPLCAALAVAGASFAMLLAALCVFASWRMFTAWRATPGFAPALAQLAAPRWPPALAMAAIALANVVLLALAGSWSFTALLTDLAAARDAPWLGRTILAVTLIVGAFVGAQTAGRFKLRGATPAELATRLAGGALMGFGAALVPGGNDTLVLIGLPLLRPEAFAAYAAMVSVIALGFLLRRATQRTP